MATKSSKAGRNGDFCKAYAASAKAEQGQLRRLLRDLKRRRKFQARRTGLDNGRVVNCSELKRIAKRLTSGVRRQETGKLIGIAPKATAANSDKAWQAAYAKCNARIPNATINRIIAEQNVRAFV